MLYLREMPSAAPISVTEHSRLALEQRRQPALGILDRIPMEQDFLPLRAVEGAHDDPLAQQSVDRAL